jgi:hypothetical protein
MAVSGHLDCSVAGKGGRGGIVGVAKSSQPSVVRKRIRNGLTLTDRLGILQRIAASTEARDRAIARLKLDDAEAQGGRLSYVEALALPPPEFPAPDAPTGTPADYKGAPPADV